MTNEEIEMLRKTFQRIEREMLYWRDKALSYKSGDWHRTSNLCVYDGMNRAMFYLTDFVEVILGEGREFPNDSISDYETKLDEAGNHFATPVIPFDQ